MSGNSCAVNNAQLLKKQPCQRDCPRRSWDCKLTCPEWEKHMQERQQVYEARANYVGTRTAGHIRTIRKHKRAERDKNNRR